MEQPAIRAFAEACPRRAGLRRASPRQRWGPGLGFLPKEVAVLLKASSTYACICIYVYIVYIYIPVMYIDIWIYGDGSSQFVNNEGIVSTLWVLAFVDQRLGCMCPGRYVCMQGNALQCKALHCNAMQCTARQGKARQGNVMECKCKCTCKCTCKCKCTWKCKCKCKCKWICKCKYKS